MTVTSSSGGRREQVRERLHLAFHAANDRAADSHSLDKMDFKLRFFIRHLVPYASGLLLWLIAYSSLSLVIIKMNLPARKEDLYSAILALGLAIVSFTFCWYGARWFFRYRLRESIAILQACIDRDAITVVEWDETFAQAGAIQPHIHGWMIYGIRKHLRSQCRLY